MILFRLCVIYLTCSSYASGLHMGMQVSVPEESESSLVCSWWSSLVRASVPAGSFPWMAHRMRRCGHGVVLV